MSDVDALSSPGDVAEILGRAHEARLCPSDLRLLLEVTSLVRANGEMLDALAALRGKLRRELVALEAPLDAPIPPAPAGA